MIVDDEMLTAAPKDSAGSDLDDFAKSWPGLLAPPRICVFMGGASGEREISMISGTQVAEALERSGAVVSRLDATPEALRRFDPSELDAVFVALHGRLGEDGTVQALLELNGVPYTGSGVAASALAMDKVRAKLLFEAAGIPVARSIAVQRLRTEDAQGQYRSICDRAEASLGFPLVVKPVSEGSALGVVIAHDRPQLDIGLHQALELDEQVLLEDFLPGTELTVAVLDEGSPVALPSVEIVPGGHFYDFEAKYAAGGSDHICPARISAELETEVGRLAVSAHQILGCRDLSRSDFKLDQEGRPHILETNTIPGMTPTSLFPEAAEAFGISFDELMVRMVRMALARSDSDPRESLV